MMRTRTDQAVDSPLGLVCILMVYVFSNLSDASPLWGGGGKAFVCVVRTGTNLSFFFFSIHLGSDEDVDTYLMAAGFQFTMMPLKAQREFCPLL